MTPSRSLIRAFLMNKLELKKTFVIFLDKVGLLKKLEREAVEYKKIIKIDGTIWVSPFRFVLPLDLLLMHSGNFDKLLYLLIFEPEQAVEIARTLILCAVKELTSLKITELEIEIATHLTLVPSVLFYSTNDFPGGLRFLRGILAAKSTPVKYVRSSVYVCQATGCIAFNRGERRRRPGSSEYCKDCYEPLCELVQFRDVGEEIVCKFVAGFEAFKTFFSFTVTVKGEKSSKRRKYSITRETYPFIFPDELISTIELDLGKEYNLVGKTEQNGFMDVWHISNRLFCRNLSKSPGRDFDSILLPRFISKLYLSIERDCENSPWAFVIAISSLLGGNVVPYTSFLHLKIGLMLSLATQSSSGQTPIPVLGVGGDTSMAQKLFRSAGRLAERYVSYSSAFAHLGGSIERGSQPGTVWLEAGGSILGTDGVCDLGDWSKFKKQQSDYIRNTLDRGEIVFSNNDAEHNNLTHSVPLKCSVWSYFNDAIASKKIDSRSRLKTLAEVFGMPFLIDERSESEIGKICKKHLRNDPEIETGFKIPEEELKEYLILVKERHSLPIRKDASELIKNYFVASRKDRPHCLPVGAIKTITELSEAHAKLALRTEVLYEDVIAIIYWYQEAATVLFGPTGFDFPPPTAEIDNKPFYVLMDERLLSFKLWLADYVSN